MTFVQENFEYKDQFSENNDLKEVIEFYFPKKFQKNVIDDLSEFAKKASTEILNLSILSEKYEPELLKYDHWGNQVDQIITHKAWNDLHRLSAREGIVAIGYERKSEEYSRLHQFLKLLLFHSSSAFYSCPLAMTDGATRVLEIESENNSVFKEYFENLSSRDEKKFWTAGQWMTEKIGGSDVSMTETYAEEKDGKYYLYGDKWFTSAITANITMALAKVGDSLSLFTLKIRDENNKLNNIEVLRLKDKLGTKAMPTAELKLKGSEAHLVGELGGGVKKVATILNITRLYNSVCATSSIYRLLSLSKDYSKKRIAFGKKLFEHPLHKKTLLDQEAQVKACIHFISSLGLLLGKSETGKSSAEDEICLRFFTPIAKLLTAKKSMAVTSELVESFGGAGYIENTGIPKFLRDAQVFSIWEGTTNILSLDVLRVLRKKEVFEIIYSKLNREIKEISNAFKLEAEFLQKNLDSLALWLKENMNDPDLLQIGARDFAVQMGNIFCALKMALYVLDSQNKREEKVFKIFVSSIVKDISDYNFLKQSEISKIDL